MTLHASCRPEVRRLMSKTAPNIFTFVGFYTQCIFVCCCFYLFVTRKLITIIIYDNAHHLAVRVTARDCQIGILLRVNLPDSDPPYGELPDRNPPRRESNLPDRDPH